MSNFPHTSTKTLNKALRLVRVYHDLTQAETARRVGFSKSYVSELESGNKKVSIEALERYAAAFKLPVSSLMILMIENQRNYEILLRTV